MSGVLAFVQAAPAVWVIVVWTLILILGGSYSLGEMIRLLTGKQPLWKKVLLYPARVVAGRIERAIKEQTARASQQFVLASPAVARLLHRTASRVEMVSGAILQTNVATYEALVRLRRTTIPTLIARALVPVNQTLTRHTERLVAIEDLNRRVAVVVGNGLRSLPWGVPGTYVGNFEAWWNTYSQLWRHVYTTLTPRVTTLWNERVPNLRNRIQALEATVRAIQTEGLPAIRLRIGRIEDWLGNLASDPTTWVLGALGLAAVPALSAVGMRTALRNLTCRNTQDFASRACATDPDFFAALLAGTLLFALALDPRIIARSGQAVTEGMMAVFRETALR
jgi:hypothetical protein